MERKIRTACIAVFGVLVGCGGASEPAPPPPSPVATAGGDATAEVGASATATAPAPAPAPAPRAEETAAGTTPGATPEAAVKRCGARESYLFVAGELECPAGGNPLGGDPQAGAASRVGNVGAGPDGHILDLYEVPCPGGPLRVYVDMYHCPDGQTPY